MSCLSHQLTPSRKVSTRKQQLKEPTRKERLQLEGFQKNQPELFEPECTGKTKNKWTNQIAKNIPLDHPKRLNCLPVIFSDRPFDCQVATRRGLVRPTSQPVRLAPVTSTEVGISLSGELLTDHRPPQWPANASSCEVTSNDQILIKGIGLFTFESLCFLTYRSIDSASVNSQKVDCDFSCRPRDSFEKASSELEILILDFKKLCPAIFKCFSD